MNQVEDIRNLLRRVVVGLHWGGSASTGVLTSAKFAYPPLYVPDIASGQASSQCAMPAPGPLAVPLAPKAVARDLGGPSATVTNDAAEEPPGL